MKRKRPYCHVKHYMKQLINYCYEIFLNFTFSKMDANARRAPNEEIHKIFAFRASGVTMHLRAHSWKSGARVCFMTRVPGRAITSLTMSSFQPNWKLIMSVLKTDCHCERKQLRNRSNKIKMPSFSVSFASLMWKTCRKTFCGYFPLWKFSCSNSFQTHFKIMIESFKA